VLLRRAYRHSLLDQSEHALGGGADVAGLPVQHRGVAGERVPIRPSLGLPLPLHFIELQNKEHQGTSMLPPSAEEGVVSQPMCTG